MTRFLAGVLSVIALGVVLIAYGLLSPRASAFTAGPAMDPYAWSMRPAVATSVAAPARTVPTSLAAPASQREATRTVERAPRRSWKRTALVIGGSTAAGAGIGGLVGGKKGALIGAAIGGGASTLYESTK